MSTLLLMPNSYLFFLTFPTGSLRVKSISKKRSADVTLQSEGNKQPKLESVTSAAGTTTNPTQANSTTSMAAVATTASGICRIKFPPFTTCLCETMYHYKRFFRKLDHRCHQNNSKPCNGYNTTNSKRLLLRQLQI
jgi:hypothetical protein